MSETNWDMRIVADGVEDPEQMMGNPRNARIHPLAQQKAMMAIFRRIGWIQRVIVNRNSGAIIDGHMRVLIALDEGQPVPVSYVEMDDEEEAFVLATFDPIAMLAVIDVTMYADLVESIVELETELRSVVDMAVGAKSPTEERHDADEPAQVDQPDTETFMFGYVHWGNIHCDCDGDSVEALTRMYQAYTADHGGKDRGFVEHLCTLLAATEQVAA